MKPSSEKNQPKIKGSKRHRSLPSRAETADRHALYEKSVQATDFEYEFVDTNFTRIRGREAHLLREDFCGTARMCCEWVSHRDANRAIGVDLDTEVLTWGREHNLAELKPEQRVRITLLEDNVLTVKTDPVDVIMAMNFSWQIFMDRDSLRGYFEKVREALAEDGIFFLDIFGGYESQKELKEKTKHKGFTYVWEQANYDPITGKIVCHIHFTFNDGSKIKEAFTYEWRLWSLPEVQELLNDAGFSNVTVYWQGEDEDGDANGEFEPATKGEADPAWVCMISAEK
jgi:SAM-dependent methyltransferase